MSRSAQAGTPAEREHLSQGVRKVIRMCEELDRVRYRLEKLAKTRLLCPLTEREEAEYEELSRRERQLMTLENARYN